MLYDAHNHLQRFSQRDDFQRLFRDLSALGIHGGVVNGTSEEDWLQVGRLARENAGWRASYGLHPWNAPHRSNGWLEGLKNALMLDASAGVGEIGLDRWIRNYDIDAQLAVFRAQLALAAEMNRPATIHCLQAWGLLEECIRHGPSLKRGFLLHAYGGPREMVAGFARHGAYFSFNGYYLHERKQAQREVFRAIPRDRLLIETDAPDMLLPEEKDSFQLKNEKKERINHPGTLRTTFDALAELLQEKPEKLSSQLAENYRRLFL